MRGILEIVICGCLCLCGLVGLGRVLAAEITEEGVGVCVVPPRSGPYAPDQGRVGKMRGPRIMQIRKVKAVQKAGGLAGKQACMMPEIICRPMPWIPTCMGFYGIVRKVSDGLYHS